MNGTMNGVAVALTRPGQDDTMSLIFDELRTLRELVSRQLAVMDEQYVSIKRSARITGLSETTIRRAVLSGELPAAQKGRGKSIYRIAKSDLVAWMAEGKSEPSSLPSRSAIQDLIDRHLGTNGAGSRRERRS